MMNAGSVPNITGIDSKERLTTKILQLKAPNSARDFYCIAKSHLGRREYFERINRLFAEHASATVIKEGRRKENDRVSLSGNAASFHDYITEQRQVFAIAADVLGIDLVDQATILHEPENALEPDLPVTNSVEILEKSGFNFDEVRRHTEKYRIVIKRLEEVKDAEGAATRDTQELLEAMRRNIHETMIGVGSHMPESNNAFRLLQDERSDALLGVVIEQSTVQSQEPVIIVYGARHIRSILPRLIERGWLIVNQEDAFAYMNEDGYRIHMDTNF